MIHSSVVHVWERDDAWLQSAPWMRGERVALPGRKPGQYLDRSLKKECSGTQDSPMKRTGPSHSLLQDTLIIHPIPLSCMYLNRRLISLEGSSNAEFVSYILVFAETRDFQVYWTPLEKVKVFILKGPQWVVGWIHKDEMFWISHIFSPVKQCTRQSKHELQDPKEGFSQTRNNLINSRNMENVKYKPSVFLANSEMLICL